MVRVAADDGMDAQRAIVEDFSPVTLKIDPDPAAAGPEWEIRVQDRPVLEVVRMLTVQGISVLASKEILDRPLDPPPELRTEIP